MNKQMLYFLRHGQTQFNVFRRLQGWSNSQLTEKGIQIAKTSGQMFKDIPFDLVYSSDLTRALDTAKIFLESARKNLPINPLSDLREIGFGYFEGMDGPSTWRLADAKAVELGIIPEGKEAPESIRIDMLHLMDPYCLAEKHEDFMNRLKNGIMGILKKHPDKKHILILSHSSVIKAIFDTFDPDFETVMEAQNGSISTMSYYNNRFKVESFNKFE